MNSLIMNEDVAAWTPTRNDVFGCFCTTLQRTPSTHFTSVSRSKTMLIASVLALWLGNTPSEHARHILKHNMICNIIQQHMLYISLYLYIWIHLHISLSLSPSPSLYIYICITSEVESSNQQNVLPRTVGGTMICEMQPSLACEINCTINYWLGVYKCRLVASAIPHEMYFRRDEWPWWDASPAQPFDTEVEWHLAKCQMLGII